MSLLLLIFTRGVDSSIGISKEAEKEITLANLFWDLQRKFFGAERVYIRGDEVYMITSGGSYYPGIVRCAYVFDNGKLLYYEEPYTSGDVTSLDMKRAKRVGEFERFRVVAVDGEEFSAYDGLPDLIRVYLGDVVFVFETLKRRAPSEPHRP